MGAYEWLGRDDEGSKRERGRGEGGGEESVMEEVAIHS